MKKLYRKYSDVVIGLICMLIGIMLAVVISVITTTCSWFDNTMTNQAEGSYKWHSPNHTRTLYIEKSKESAEEFCKDQSDGTLVCVVDDDVTLYDVKDGKLDRPIQFWAKTKFAFCI